MAKVINIFLCFVIFIGSGLPLEAADISLPEASQRIELSRAFDLPSVRGMQFDKNDPFKFAFIVDKGSVAMAQPAFQDESSKIISYFLTALTIPGKDLWVNLSPAEPGRVITNELVKTGLGEGMLGQDYVLKQMFASLTYPESESGKKFWDKVYARAREKLGNKNIPVSTYNKVWIMPQKAVVNEEDDRAVISEARLKVMLEEDYLALKSVRSPQSAVRSQEEVNTISSGVMREVLIPIIEEEVNRGENFAALRQIYYSVIMAAWFKSKLKDSILEKTYVNKKKVKGIDTADPAAKEKVYSRYLEAYKKGAYNYIRKDLDSSGSFVRRRYVSGGCTLDVANTMQVNYGITRFGEPNVIFRINPIMPASGMEEGLDMSYFTEESDSVALAMMFHVEADMDRCWFQDEHDARKKIKYLLEHPNMGKATIGFVYPNGEKFYRTFRCNPNGDIFDATVAIELVYNKDGSSIDDDEHEIIARFKSAKLSAVENLRKAGLDPLDNTNEPEKLRIIAEAFIPAMELLGVKRISDFPGYAAVFKCLSSLDGKDIRITGIDINLFLYACALKWSARNASSSNEDDAAMINELLQEIQSSLEVSDLVQELLKKEGMDIQSVLAEVRLRNISQELRNALSWLDAQYGNIGNWAASAQGMVMETMIEGKFQVSVSDERSVVRQILQHFGAQPMETQVDVNTAFNDQEKTVMAAFICLVHGQRERAEAILDAQNVERMREFGPELVAEFAELLKNDSIFTVWQTEMEMLIAGQMNITEEGLRRIIAGLTEKQQILQEVARSLPQDKIDLRLYEFKPTTLEKARIEHIRATRKLEFPPEFHDLLNAVRQAIDKERRSTPKELISEDFIQAERRVNKILRPLSEAEISESEVRQRIKRNFGLGKEEPIPLEFIEIDHNGELEVLSDIAGIISPDDIIHPSAGRDPAQAIQDFVKLYWRGVMNKNSAPYTIGVILQKYLEGYINARGMAERKWGDHNTYDALRLISGLIEIFVEKQYRVREGKNYSFPYDNVSVIYIGDCPISMAKAGEKTYQVVDFSPEDVKGLIAGLKQYLESVPSLLKKAQPMENGGKRGVLPRINEWFDNGWHITMVSLGVGAIAAGAILIAGSLLVDPQTSQRYEDSVNAISDTSARAKDSVQMQKNLGAALYWHYYIANPMENGGVDMDISGLRVKGKSNALPGFSPDAPLENIAGFTFEILEARI